MKIVDRLRVGKKVQNVAVCGELKLRDTVYLSTLSPKMLSELFGKDDTATP